jgi:phosphoglycerate dehydrogenase-like enzyme
LLSAPHHFLNTAGIARLPQGAIVVNAARGGLVVDEDLIVRISDNAWPELPEPPQDDARFFCHRSAAN